MATAEAAKSIAASIINGDIVEVTHTSEVHVLRIPSDYLPLRNTPLVSVSAVSVGDDTVAAGDDDGFTLDRFGIRRKYPYLWPTGKITVTYKTGWADGDEPTAVSEALAMLETWIDSKPELNATRIQIGDESIWREASANGSDFPNASRLLLAPWVRPHA